MTTEKTGATAERFLPESEVRRVVNDGRNFPFATICTQRAVGEAIEQIPRVNVKTIRYGRWLDGHCTACGWEIPDRVSYDGYDDEAWELTPYCPMCGAEMQEER